MLSAPTDAARRLLLEGAVALAEITHNGMRIDVPYLQAAIADVAGRIKRNEERMRADPVYTVWRKAYGAESNLGSREQLAHVLFEIMGYPCARRTAGRDGKPGRPAADDTALSAVDLPFIKGYLRTEQLKKLKSTYLEGVLSETIDGYLHPNFNLHKVDTFRGCVAKGTLIEVVRDVKERPKGIPIENVKAGDYVYCYDANRRLAIRKVLWAGRTGHKKVIRLHWSARGKHGHLDVTPEHKIRMTSGEYVEARRLVKGADFRTAEMSNRAPKLGTLAMGRVGDRLFETGNATAIYDHHLVYEAFYGKLGPGEIVHHFDDNHLNNNPVNLIKTTLSEHATVHHKTFGPVISRKGLEAIKSARPIHGEKWKRFGDDNPNALKLSRYQFLRLLAKAKGKLKYINHDFTTIKNRAKKEGISIHAVKSRYGRGGRYIAKGPLIDAHTRGINNVMIEFNLGYYQCQEVLKTRGLSTARRWGNQFGEFIPNNHKITDLEYLEEAVDVYDIEVEECHNFIANEICVHNSSSDPNFQNIPIRDPEIGRLIRTAFIPRPGRVLVETDYAAHEFRIIASCSADPSMIQYVVDDNDPHANATKDCYLLDEVVKSARSVVKAAFVFAEIYGDFYVQVARNLWDHIASGNLKTSAGVGLYEHLASRGITSLGACDARQAPAPGTFEGVIKRAEEKLKKEQFPTCFNWLDSRWAEYKNCGYFDTPTGFVLKGVFKKNFVFNAPIQGSAFHCVLWSLTQIQKELKRRRMKTLLIGQIHDSIEADVYEPELQDYLNLVREVMTVAIRKHWAWILTPLGIESSVGIENWWGKEEWVDRGTGTWAPKKKAA